MPGCCLALHGIKRSIHLAMKRSGPRDCLRALTLASAGGAVSICGAVSEADLGAPSSGGAPGSLAAMEALVGLALGANETGRVLCLWRAAETPLILALSKRCLAEIPL